MKFCNQKVILIVIFASILVNCSKKQGKSGHSIGIILGPAPATLDWHQTHDERSGLINLNVMEGLFTVETRHSQYNYQKALVKSYSSDRLHRNWKFCLKDKVLWSDGVPLQVAHIIAGWKRLLDPKTASPHSHHFFVVRGAKNYYAGKTDFSTVGIKEFKDNCLKVELTQSMPDFPFLLAAPYSFPVRADIIKKWGSHWGGEGSFAGLGPYRYQSGGLQKQLVLERNPNYHGAKPEVQKATFQWVDSKVTAKRLFRQGHVDLIKSPDQETLTREEIKDYFVSYPGLGTTLLAFNFKHQSGLNFKQRRTLKESLKNLALEKALAEKGEITARWIPKVIAGYSLDQPSTLKNSEALTFPTPIVLQSNTTPLNKQVLQALSFHWGKNLKAQVELQFADSASYLGQLRTNNRSQIFRLSYLPGFLSPLSYLKFFTSDSQSNYGRFNDPEYDKLVQSVALAPTKVARLRAVKQAESYLLNQAVAIVPLFRNRQNYMIRKNKIRFTPHWSERLEIKNISIVKRVP